MGAESTGWDGHLGCEDSPSYCYNFRLRIHEPNSMIKLGKVLVERFGEICAPPVRVEKSWLIVSWIGDAKCPTSGCRCAVRSAMEAPQDDQAEDEGWEVPTKRVRAHMRMLLGEPPQTLCLHFPRRHQR